MSLITRFAALATVSFAACVVGHYPAISLGQTKVAFQSPPAGTNLVAVMPDRARVGWWVLPADSSWFANGFSGNFLVIEQRWLIAPGTSVDADCTVAPPIGQVAELMPLDQFEGALARHSFLDVAGARTISLAPHPLSGSKPQVNIRALLLAHEDPLIDPVVVHIRLVAF